MGKNKSQEKNKSAEKNWISEMQTNAMAGNTWLPDKNQTGWKWECLSQVFKYEMCNFGKYILINQDC